MCGGGGGEGGGAVASYTAAEPCGQQDKIRRLLSDLSPVNDPGDWVVTKATATKSYSSPCQNQRFACWAPTPVHWSPTPGPCSVRCVGCCCVRVSHKSCCDASKQIANRLFTVINLPLAFFLSLAPAVPLCSSDATGLSLPVLKIKTICFHIFQCDIV